MRSSFNSMKPLHGRTAVVACSEAKLKKLKPALEALGAHVLPFPAIEIRELKDNGLLDDALESITEYSWIIFTSAYGVRFFMRRMVQRGGRPAAMPKICAIGPATAEAVNEFKCEVTIVPEKFVAEGIVEALMKYSGGLSSLAGQHILVPRAKEGREILPEALVSAGARVDVVPCYENVRPDLQEDVLQQLRTVRPDLLIFTSSSTVRNMIDILGHEDGKRMLLESVVAVLGPVTGNTAESFGKRAEIVPKESTVKALLEEICEHYRNYSISKRRQ